MRRLKLGQGLRGGWHDLGGAAADVFSGERAKIPRRQRDSLYKVPLPKASDATLMRLSLDLRGRISGSCNFRSQFQ